MGESFWMVKLVDHPLYDDEGRVLLFASQAEAIEAGLAAWGAVEQYVCADECRVSPTADLELRATLMRIEELAAEKASRSRFALQIYDLAHDALWPYEASHNVRSEVEYWNPETGRWE